MNILVACHEKVKRQQETVFKEIERYWEKAGFEVSYSIRNDENVIRTAIDVKDVPTDYLIIVDGVGFEAATTQGKLSYNNYAGIVLFLFLDNLLFEKYQDLEYGLNCYILVSDPQFEICKKSKNIYNVYKIPRHKEEYDWTCFTEIREDAVETKRVAEKEYKKTTGLLEKIGEKQSEQKRIESEINEKLMTVFSGESNIKIDEIMEFLSHADKDIQLLFEKEYQSLNVILEIWKLEIKGSYPLCLNGLETWEELVEGYNVFLSVMNRFVLPAVETDKEEGLQWIVSNHISPFAIVVVLEREYDCKERAVYQYFATMFQALNDWKGV